MSFSSTPALAGATAETQHFHHFGGSDRSQASAATGCQIDRLTIFPPQLRTKVAYFNRIEWLTLDSFSAMAALQARRRPLRAGVPRLCRGRRSAPPSAQPLTVRQGDGLLRRSTRLRKIVGSGPYRFLPDEAIFR